MYADRYMKADETYDYVTNGVSRHNSWQSETINAGDGKVQLDAPTGFRIDDFTARVASSSTGGAANNGPVAIASTSNANVILQTPVTSSSINLIYKLTA